MEKEINISKNVINEEVKRILIKWVNEEELNNMEKIIISLYYNLMKKIKKETKKKGKK